MDKKTLTIVGIIGVVIIALVVAVFGMQTQTNELSAEEIMRVNQEVYSKEEFLKYLRYTLYQKEGKIEIDEEKYAANLSGGATKESIFISQTLEEFYELKVFGIFAAKNNITLSEDEQTAVETAYTENEEKIAQFGLSKEDFMAIEKQQAIAKKIEDTPGEYVKLTDEVYSGVLSRFSGDDLKSYDYRIMQVGYSTDTENESGETISGDRAEKETFIHEAVARVKSGESFETVAESGDTRIIRVGQSFQLAASMLEHSAGLLLPEKIYSTELVEAMKKTPAGEMTEIIDTGSAFEVAYMEGVHDTIEGESKEELSDLIISSNYTDMIMEAVVTGVEFNHSAIQRIKIQ